MTPNYSGEELVLFGSIERDGKSRDKAEYDIVVTVSGPRANMVTRRKERKLGIWINVDSREFIQVPSYLGIFSNRPIDEIAAADVQRRQQIGLNNVFLPQRIGPDVANVVASDPFRIAFVKLRTDPWTLSPAGKRGDVPDADTIPHRHSAAGRGADRHL